ncbi:MAG: formate dehydrogenase accessory protein FdhE [Gemmatimonadetes bacterium]|uniref:Formate dehydrogenase accessory protein FdhE n=1 Tax=Candidatus Kutchimonas denitrificans TaxID=3056748 RepID=A0AAE4Z4I1_9BACT|nr:formate dehydrogenase accessory protein FdhE [Gemmatimonadota bacterium]NIR73614.1 formate dehydrogenase accessory protein FdhE [Candidatus Kutchimonas denitrificans]NIR99573.1 formate dehydrogenase accessory protein FdhE [Gemmatimonadota bacterium]NIT65193.1 formate dehydrogenase accessory protein FdhE [Gemmatimonadota bacterium]NIV23726.1 formate dehydrogenase accessory protein FdhE [Gemmatimonadota bacterium]
MKAIEERQPESRVYLRLLRIATDAADDGWYAPLTGDAAPPGAPRLHGATLGVDGRRVQELLTRLLAATADGESASPPGAVSRSDAVAVLESALRFDAERLAGLAARVGGREGGLDAVAGFLALPVLYAAAARARKADLPEHWPHGHCPLCGARALLAEIRGLDRARLLRCGRCGSAWRMTWLRCAHCGESDHEKLGALLPEGSEETRKVETCATCRGYLKSLTTLQARPLTELLLADLETLEFDLAAMERGYIRPAGPGAALEVRVIDREGTA